MAKSINKYEQLAESLQGFYSLETLMDRLKVTRLKAIYVIYRLRKLGFVKTSYGSGKKRVYYISLKNKQKGITYTERINEVAPSASYAIISSNPHYVYGRTPTYEEVLIYAIKQRDVRYLVASLALFRKISDWNLLYRLAKQENLVREVAALYEIARRTVKKIRRMPRRFISLAQKRKPSRFYYITKGLSSDDFQDIERKWKIYIPLNRADVEEYTR